MNLIVAADANWGIGLNNKLLVSIPSASIARKTFFVLSIQILSGLEDSLL